MPEKAKTIQEWSRTPAADYQEFIRWARQAYGLRASVAFNQVNYKDTAAYNYWKNYVAGQPAQVSLASGATGGNLPFYSGGFEEMETQQAPYAFPSDFTPGQTPTWSATPPEPTAGPSPGGGGQQFYSPTPAGGRGDMQWEFAPPKYDDVGNVIFQGGYYQVPLDQMQQQRFAREDAQAIAAYNAQAQQWQAQAFQNERQAEIEREKMQQEAAQVKAQQDIEKQKYLAQLAAQPQSWLEYSAAGGGVPTIQPWMQPLMQPGYQIASRGGDAAYAVTAQDIQAGKPIPGYGMIPFESGGVGYATEPGPGGVPTRVETEDYIWREAPYWSKPGHISPYRSTGEGGTPDYSKLPQLQTPDRAYWEGLGPTSQSQYLGYETARTGAPGLETLWRLPWEQTKRALPSGGGMSLSYRR